MSGRRWSDVIEDERGRISSARCLLWVWSVFALVLIALTWRTVGNPVLAFLSGVEVALIAWAAGPRIAQYLGPQVAATAGAVGQSVRDAIAKRRDPADGIERPT